MDKKDRSTLTGVSQETDSPTAHYSRREVNSVRKAIGAFMLVATLVLSACSSSTSTVTPVMTVPPASVRQDTATPQVIAPTVTKAPQNTATPVPAQACQVRRL